MGSTKRLSSSYTIHTINGDSITIDTRDKTLKASDIFIYGNLVVSGSTAQVSSTNLTVSDNVLTLNKGETGAGVTLNSAGVEVDRGTEPTVSLRWYEPAQKWQLTTDGATFANIATALSENYLTSIVEDVTPTLGGNLDVNGYTIGSSNPLKNVAFSAPLQLATSSTIPSVVTGETLIYAAPSTGGGTGLYVSNSTYQNRELISKKKALAYALLF